MVGGATVEDIPVGGGTDFDMAGGACGNLGGPEPIPVGGADPIVGGADPIVVGGANPIVGGADPKVVGGGGADPIVGGADPIIGGAPIEVWLPIAVGGRGWLYIPSPPGGGGREVTGKVEGE